MNRTTLVALSGILGCETGGLIGAASGGIAGAATAYDGLKQGINHIRLD